MPTFKLTIAYDGTDFCGWQKQEPVDIGIGPQPQSGKVIGSVEREGEDRPRLQLRTVQEVIDRAVTTIVRERVNIKGSSRTDSGVHAKGQVARFACSGDEGSHTGWPLSRGTERLLRAINGRLPDDVLVTSCEVVPDDFDPGSCTAKSYSYTIHASRERPLWDRRYVYHLWETLDVDLMQAAAQRLVGEHDFAAFAAAGHGRLSTVRTIFSCDVTRAGEERIRIDVSGSGFLYNMVRIIAGTLCDAGRGRTRPDDIPAIIAGKDRRNAGVTLPPQGLCLEWIKY